MRDVTACDAACDCVLDGAVWVLLLCHSVASKMEKKLETDNLEMRIQALESRIYGERGRKSAKPVKVRPEYSSYLLKVLLAKMLGRC